MKDKSKFVAIILVIITIAVLIISTIFRKDDKEENEIKIVTNYSNFYTVNSCLYRVVTYLYDKDINSLMLLLSDDYKKENNVTEENVLNLFNNIDVDSTFESRKMYYEQLTKNITKYYVYGRISSQMFEEEYESNPEYNDAYFIVYLDTDKKIFSIEPYDGKIFIGGDNIE